MEKKCLVKNIPTIPSLLYRLEMSSLHMKLSQKEERAIVCINNILQVRYIEHYKDLWVHEKLKMTSAKRFLSSSELKFSLKQKHS